MVELHWIPLGAGGHFVAFNGRVYEALAATHGRRTRRALYHTALATDACAIEMGPASRGARVTGSVGCRAAGRLRMFRYEVRCGRTIPDLASAVLSQRLSDEPQVAARVVELAALVPTPVWGRDELRVGEMWTSNSVIAWVLARAGLADGVAVPPGGRAPGWHAGLRVASRSSDACWGDPRWPVCTPANAP